MQWSAAITPGPPALVTTASRLPDVRTPESSVFAVAKKSVKSSTRSAPARRRAESNTASEPTRAPVWETAAFEPCSWRPDFMITTGLVRAAARSALMKRRASLMPST